MGKFVYLLLFAIGLSFHIANAKTVTIAAISDFNGGLGSLKYYSHKQAIKSIHRLNPSLVLGIGDLVSGEDYKHKFPKPHFAKMWRNFESEILDPLTWNGKRRVLFAPTPGNHDAPHGSKMKRERDAFEDFWSRQSLGINKHDFSNFPFYYSFTHKGVFFISLNDVRSGSLVDSSAQKSWIKKQLRSSAANRANARIVFGHVPLYPVLDKSKHRKGSKKYYAVLHKEQVGKKSGKQNPNGLAQVLLDNNVNLAVFAHSHAYFPGKLVSKKTGQSMQILSMPCSGPGQRYLHGQKKKSKRGFGLIKITASKIEVDMYTNGGTKVSKKKLPKRIPVPDKLVKYLRD